MQLMLNFPAFVRPLRFRSTGCWRQDHEAFEGTPRVLHTELKQSFHPKHLLGKPALVLDLFTLRAYGWKEREREREIERERDWKANSVFASVCLWYNIANHRCFLFFFRRFICRAENKLLESHPFGLGTRPGSAEGLDVVVVAKSLCHWLRDVGGLTFQSHIPPVLRFFN